MSKAIQDYVKFNVLGIEEDLVSNEDKDLIKRLNARKHIMQRAIDKHNEYVIQSYPLTTQCDIFNGLKLRQGQKCRLTFMNDQNIPVEILGAELKDDKVLLRCVFCRTRKTFKMWLDTFLSEYFSGDIDKVKPDKFAEYYLKSLHVSLSEVKAELNTIKEKYNKIYKDKEEALKQGYDTELAKYDRITKEANSQRYQMSAEEALEKAKAFKGLERTKDYWNTRISQEEKDSLLKWISENIYSIRVYGLLDGQSGNTLLNEYADVGDVKIRPVKTNEEGKVTSQDSIVAHISFKQVEDAPINILKKVVSTKGRNENIFYNNRLNDKNLALFLLSEYHDKGFKAGVRNLYKEIKTA